MDAVWSKPGEKPARKDVFEIVCVRGGAGGGGWYSYWDGERFLAITRDPLEAKEWGERWLDIYGNGGAGVMVVSDGAWRERAGKPE